MTSGVTNPNSSDLKTELRNSQEENEASTMNEWMEESLSETSTISSSNSTSTGSVFHGSESAFLWKKHNRIVLYFHFPKNHSIVILILPSNCEAG